MVGGCSGLTNKSGRATVASDTQVGLAMRAQFALSAKDYVSAVNYAEQAAEKTPGDAGVRALLGNAYFASGRFNSAEGAYRDSGKDEGATIVIQTPSRNGWFWYIPLHDNVVSVGVVAPFDYLFKGRGPYAETYEQEVAACPAVKDRVSKAKRVTGYFATKDYSYRATEVAGDGWVMVGDAFGFLDPLYSSGVLLALRSGEQAADAICEGLEKGDTSKAQLGKWGPAFNEGVDRMRRLVCEYYEGFSFGRFVKGFPHLQGTVTDILIGDVFTDRVDQVWGPMESLYEPGKKPMFSWKP